MVKLVDGLGNGKVLLLLGKDERVTDLQHRKRKGEQASRKKVCGDEGNGDFPQGSQWRAAEILCRLLERDARLLKSRCSGAHHIGQAADRIGNDQNDQRIDRGIQKGEWFPLLGHGKVAECQHEARDSEREHRHGIEDLPPREPGSHHDISDGDAEDHIEDGGKTGVLDAVPDRGEREVVTQGGFEVRKRPSAWQDRLIPIRRECHEDDADVGKDSEKGHQTEQR